MKLLCGFAVVFLLALAHLGWAFCPEDLFTKDIAELPGQRTPFGAS